jgi:hypothetical protein
MASISHDCEPLQSIAQIPATAIENLDLPSDGQWEPGLRFEVTVNETFQVFGVNFQEGGLPSK